MQLQRQAGETAADEVKLLSGGLRNKHGLLLSNELERSGMLELRETILKSGLYINHYSSNNV